MSQDDKKAKEEAEQQYVDLMLQVEDGLYDGDGPADVAEVSQEYHDEGPA